MFEKFKAWLIHKLGGCTQGERRESWEYFYGKARYWRDRAVLNSRDAKSWEDRARLAEARVKVLEERFSKAIHLREEEHLTKERLFLAGMPEEGVDAWIKSRMATRLAATILDKIGFTCMDDRIRQEYVWKCEAYLLKKEDN